MSAPSRILVHGPFFSVANGKEISPPDGDAFSVGPALPDHDKWSVFLRSGQEMQPGIRAIVMYLSTEEMEALAAWLTRTLETKRMEGIALRCIEGCARVAAETDKIAPIAQEPLA